MAIDADRLAAAPPAADPPAAAAAPHPAPDQAAAPAAAPTPRRGLAVLKDPRALVAGGSLAPLLVLYGHTAVDAIDEAGFNVILPEIRKTFDLDLTEVATLGGITLIVGLLLSIPLSVRSEQTKHRTWFLAGGAGVAAFFSIFAGVAPTLLLFTIARGGFGLGLRLNDPVQQSLLADYYPVHTRTGVFAGREMVRRFGRLVGPAVFGTAAQLFGWRPLLIAVAIPSAILFFASLRLPEVSRGAPERELLGLTEDPDLEDEPPTLEEAFAILRRVGTVRRLWYALPFLVGGLLALGVVIPLFAEEVFGLQARSRGFISSAGEGAALLGLVITAPLTARFLRGGNPEKVFPLVAVQSVVGAVAVLGVALAPNVPLFVLALMILNFNGALLTPVFGVLFSLVIPPRVRTIGFAVGALWALPGLLVLPFLGSIGDSAGLRTGIAVAAPMLLIGGLLMATGGRQFQADMKAATLAAGATEEDRAAREAGRAKLLVCRGVELRYGQVQVLFGIDFDVEEGEMVALLGTNGAGKSSLLRAISGTAQPSAGTILFEGRDISNASAAQTAARGLVQVPGGRGIFPTLTVEENLRVASWLFRRDPDHLEAAIDRVLEQFPVLRRRFDQPAGNLSGGEQQMLVLSQAFIAKPKLLAIDELSLGLAPAIVQQLLGMVRAIHAEGVTVVLVEQSVNVALSVCQRAVFLEKGEVRFEGPTAELLQRPDILRSVFLEGATKGLGGDGPEAAAVAARPRRRIDHDQLVDLGIDLPKLLEVQGLTKSFGGIRAVHDVSLVLHQQEILGLIGSNGAGKTTIFDLLSGFLEPDAGTIVLDGVDVTTMPPHERAQRRLGRSFQDARLFPSLTARECIAVALERHLRVRDPLAAAVGAPSSREEELAVAERVEELLDLMGLEAFGDKFVSELSTGSRRIVDLACSLAHEPRVLLLDEPSSGIAQRETEALGPLLVRIQRETGCSLLVIEHDMPLISGICDRLVALEAGTQIAAGTPDEVLRNERVVASYLGTDDTVIARSGTGSGGRTTSRRRAAGGPATARRTPLRSPTRPPAPTARP